METYGVSVSIVIEAESENEAILEFYKRMNECAFEWDAVNITKVVLVAK